MSISFFEDIRSNMTNMFYFAVNHPYNVEMKYGILPRGKFLYYAEQDRYFLEQFAVCLELVARKISPQYADFFITNANICKNHAKSLVAITSDSLIKSDASLVTYNYMKSMEETCSQSIEVAIAFILPCFLLYEEVGISMVGFIEDNPYKDWVSGYVSDSFVETVDTMIAIFEELAAKADQQTRIEMKKAFFDSAVQEIAMWSDAYILGDEKEMTLGEGREY